MDGERHVELTDLTHILQGMALAFSQTISYLLIVAGVYDALQKKYLKTLLFSVCEAVEGPMIEEYACKILLVQYTLGVSLT